MNKLTVYVPNTSKSPILFRIEREHMKYDTFVYYMDKRTFRFTEISPRNVMADSYYADCEKFVSLYTERFEKFMKQCHLLSLTLNQYIQSDGLFNTFFMPDENDDKVYFVKMTHSGYPNLMIPKHDEISHYEEMFPHLWINYSKDIEDKIRYIMDKMYDMVQELLKEIKTNPPTDEQDS